MAYKGFEVIHYETFGKWAGSGTVYGHLLAKGSSRTLCGKETSTAKGASMSWTRRFSTFTPGDCKRCAAKANAPEKTS